MSRLNQIEWRVCYGMIWGFCSPFFFLLKAINSFAKGSVSCENYKYKLEWAEERRITLAPSFPLCVLSTRCELWVRTYGTIAKEWGKEASSLNSSPGWKCAWVQPGRLGLQYRYCGFGGSWAPSSGNLAPVRLAWGASLRLGRGVWVRLVNGSAVAQEEVQTEMKTRIIFLRFPCVQIAGTWVK